MLEKLVGTVWGPFDGKENSKAGFDWTGYRH